MCSIDAPMVDNSKFGQTDTQTKLLLKLESYHESNDPDGKRRLNSSRPSQLSTCITLSVLILFFILIEQFSRYFIYTFIRGLDPIFDDEKNRHILARHIGVDALACAIVSYLGYMNRQPLSEVLNIADVGRVNIASLLKLKTKGASRRIYGYVPEGHQLLIFFLAYQMKNMYDTIVWNDGALFIFHHILSGVAAWVGLYPGVAQVYGLFFMGMSEMSTGILVVLANFDSTHGIVGMGETFPTIKLIFGMLFVLSFIYCRVVLWPLFTYHFINDANIVLETDSKTLSLQAKFAIHLLVKSCQGLSILQVVFLGQIFLSLYEELIA